MQKLSVKELVSSFNLNFNKLSQATDTRISQLQPRVSSAFRRLCGPSNLSNSQVLILEGYPGVDYEYITCQLIAESGGLTARRPMFDLVYAENIANPLKPTCLTLRSGTGSDFCEHTTKLLDLLLKHVDAEEAVNHILAKQPGNDKLANYLTALSEKVLKGEPFTNEVIMNLMVAHEKNRVPIIYGRDLNWNNLFGKINYLTEQGTVYSHQNLLEPGLVRIANGGYLILPIEELVRQPHLWYKLSNALAVGSLDWENNTQDSSSIVPFFEPEPTDINLTVILVGDYLDISNFYALDINALENIELKASLTETVDSHKLEFFTGYLKDIMLRFELQDFSVNAVKRICRYAQRQCDTKNQFMIVETRLVSLMKLASDISLENEHDTVEQEDVSAAIEEKEFRSNLIVEESSKMYQEGQILISTSGTQTGQINGLSVVSTSGSDYEYGEPLRITATIHVGEGDISDVQQKANMAGQIHQKAMMIINGFLSHKFAQNEPLPFSSTLVFEQSYSEIDGDSASLSGLCAVLSALAETPIKQCFAVTGALDQFGHVQPVGGLNEKIEGFYRVCKIKGLTGEESVIIPNSNVSQLVLSDEVMDAVNRGSFAIYTVETLDETIELLTGIKAGSPEEGDTFYGRIQNRINAMNGKPESSFWSRLLGKK
ncbi:MAG: AAA family ATPase [Succinivibrionaceae bacterium]